MHPYRKALAGLCGCQRGAPTTAAAAAATSVAARAKGMFNSAKRKGKPWGWSVDEMDLGGGGGAGDCLLDDGVDEDAQSECVVASVAVRRCRLNTSG